LALQRTPHTRVGIDVTTMGEPRASRPPSGNRGDIAYVQQELTLLTKIFLIVVMEQHMLLA
jgi:hypothetical protein